MLRISALNDSSSSDDDSQKIELTKTKEAKEAEAFAVYNKALSHQQKGNTLHAEKLLRNLFDHPLVKEASRLVDDENQTQTIVNHPGLQLLYSIQKNLASILLQRAQLREAMAAYIEAVKIDASDVTVWFKMGQVARELHNYPLAKVCFQQALQCNPNHWPSLDHAITVTYALGDYLMCLENISTALEKDYSYPKGLALRKQILLEQPSLESVTSELFLYCDPRIHQITIDKDETKEYINEALKIRSKRRQLVLEYKEKEMQPLRFLKPLTPFTWKHVGQQLIDLYDYAVNSTPPKSLALEVDLRDYFFLDHMAFLRENMPEDKSFRQPPVEAKAVQRPYEKCVEKITLNLSENEANSAFKRANDKAGEVLLVLPQSVNIKDTAKESALIRRIHGDVSHADTPDVFDKMSSEECQLDLANDDLELESMDISDVPLLPEEDINMAVLSLKDMRRGDFQPDLLLKTNVEDMSDVRTLENVLSSVIDMEMQDLYPKTFTSNLEAAPSSKVCVPASTGIVCTEVETQKQSTEAVDKFTTTISLEDFKQPEADAINIADSTSQTNIPMILQTCLTSPDHVLNLKAHALQTQSTSPLLKTNTLPFVHTTPKLSPVMKVNVLPRAQASPSQSPQVITSRAIISPPQAHTTPTQSPQQAITSRAIISPPPAHSTPTQSPHQTNPSLRGSFSPPPAHSSPSTTHISLHSQTILPYSFFTQPQKSICTTTTTLDHTSLHTPAPQNSSFPSGTSSRLTTSLNTPFQVPTSQLSSIHPRSSSQTSLNTSSDKTSFQASANHSSSIHLHPLSITSILSPAISSSNALNAANSILLHSLPKTPTLSPTCTFVPGLPTSSVHLQSSAQTKDSALNQTSLLAPATQSSPLQLHLSPEASISTSQSNTTKNSSIQPQLASQTSKTQTVLQSLANYNSSSTNIQLQTQSTLRPAISASTDATLLLSIHSSTTQLPAPSPTSAPTSAQPSVQSLATHSSPLYPSPRTTTSASTQPSLQVLNPSMQSSTHHRQTSQPIPATSATSSQLTSKSTAPQSKSTISHTSEQLLHAPRISMLPSEYMHSPITTSLLSPNSSGSGSKSMSAYQSALSNIEQSSPDFQLYKSAKSNQPGQKLEVSPIKYTLNSPLSPQEASTPLKSSSERMLSKSSIIQDKIISHEDILSAIRSKTQGDSSMNRSSQQQKTYHSQIPLHHSSPQPTQGLVKSSLIHQSLHQKEAAQSLVKHSLAQNVLPHSSLVLSQAEAPTYLPLRYASRNDKDLFPISSLSLLEAEAFLAERKAEKQTSHKQSSLKRSKPPPLSRSSSLPGYYTQTPEQSLLSYFSPPSPKTPRSASPFHLSGSQLPHTSKQQTVSLPSSLTNLIPSPLYLPSTLPISPQDLKLNPLYANLYSGHPTPHQIFAQTTLPPYLTPPRPQKFIDSYYKHLENMMLVTKPTKHSIMVDKNEKPHKEPKISKSSSVSSSSSVGRQHSQTSTTPPHSSLKSSLPQPHSSPHLSLLSPHNLPQSSLSQPHSSLKSSLLLPHSSPQANLPFPHSSPKSNLPLPPSSPHSSLLSPHNMPQSNLPLPHSSPKSALPPPHNSPKSSLPTPPPHSSPQSSLLSPHSLHKSAPPHNSPQLGLTLQHSLLQSNIPPPPHSSPQHGQTNPQSPKQSPSITQIQNLAKLTQQLSHSEDIRSVSGDHSYHQKRGLVFQAMIESMLSTAGSQSRPAPQHSLLVPSKSPQYESGGSSVSETSKKKAQGVAKAPGSGAKRGPKRKIDDSASDDWANAFKRRSTRSRSSRSRKDDKSVDYQSLMKKYFPPSLLNLEQNSERLDENSIDVEVNVSWENDGAGKFDFTSLKNLTFDEEEAIKKYITKCLKGHGLLDLIFKFLLFLAVRYNLVWYEGITDIYMSLYVRLRKHLTIPMLMCGDDNMFTPQGLREYATVILTWCELSLSKVSTERADRSYLLAAKSGQPERTVSDSLGAYHNQDLMFLTSLTGRDDALDSFRGEFCVRLYWMKARHHQLQNETLDAVECFEIVSELLEDVSSEQNLTRNNVRITVPNISQDRVISLSDANRQLESLQRCKSLEDTQRLYDQAQYDKVVDNLVSTFNKNLTTKSFTQRERPSQLVLLVNSLYNTKQNSECIKWAELSLREAVVHYKRVPTLQLRQEWAATLIALFTCINRIMDEDDAILKSVPNNSLVHLANSLVLVIEICLDVSDLVTEMPINSLLPWKILYRVINFEEMASGPKVSSSQEPSQRDEDKDDQDEKDLSPSLLMLREAHEFLGRHSWCTRDDGALLLFVMSVVEREMEGKAEDDLEELSSIFEQCVYCLYGHPNKRGRARHLCDHNSIPVKLTWERAGPIFRHFASQSVPEFDSYRTSTVTADVENLMRRIFALVPEKINPGQNLSVVTDYIEGVSSSFPTSPVMSVDKDLDPFNISGLLYYLLGDFYFKSKEPAKAVKFYQLDLVLNSTRFDSWAGLALARQSQIEQKLNSTELKIEKPIHKNSEGALRCFRRAVDLETGSSKLWMEYGSLAYQLHSHASRQIKCKDMFFISEEVLQLAITKCLDMLLVAKNSYQQASKCEGEDTEEGWLTFYMLGKVSEKQMEDPSVCLEYYKQAAACMHEERASYPKKIQFVNPRPHLALEALEIFYRTHAFALKLVLTGCDDKHLIVLFRHVTAAMNGHFARCEEKSQVVEEDDREEIFPTTKSSTENSSTPSKQQLQQEVYHKNPFDHEYSRIKSRNEPLSGKEDSKSQLIVQSADVQNNVNVSAIQQTLSLDKSTALVESEHKSHLCQGSQGLSEHMQPNSKYVECSNLLEKPAEDRAHLDLLNQNINTVCASVNDAQIEQRVELDESRMDTDEMGKECKDVYDGIERERNETALVKPIPKQEDGSERTSEKDTIDLCLSEADMNTSQVLKPNEEMLEISQNSKVWEVPLIDSQARSQESVEMSSSHLENVGSTSCDVDKNVKQEAMEVDDKCMSTSCPISQDSSHTLVLPSQIINQEQETYKIGYPKVNEIEVHTNEELPEASNVPPVNFNRQVTEGFVPENIKEVTDMDLDLFEDSKNISVGLNDNKSLQLSDREKQQKVTERENDKGQILSETDVEKCQQLSEIGNDKDQNLSNTENEKLLMSLSETDNENSLNLSNEDSNKKLNILERDEDKSLTISQTNDSVAILSQFPNQHEIQVKVIIEAQSESEQKNFSVPKPDDTSDSTERLKTVTNNVLEDNEKDTSINQDNRCDNNLPTKMSNSSLESAGISSVQSIDISVEKQDLDVIENMKESDSNKTKKLKHGSDYFAKDGDEKWEKEGQEKLCSQIIKSSDEEMNDKMSGIEEMDTKPSELSDPKIVNTKSMELSDTGSVQPRQSSDVNVCTEKKIQADAVSSIEQGVDNDDIPENLENLKLEIISKCRSGLEICVSRFPSHYKSLYRLAHLYYKTKELDKARDILLGRNDWQDQPHMPGPGLFSERKLNNFFQGLWKITVEEVERSGNFATHVHRSVVLLLEVLCELGDLEMLKNLHNQLRRTPEAGKKYLRDAERLVLAEEAYLKCVIVVQQEMEKNTSWSEEQREENLLRVYQVWQSGKGSKHIDKVTEALHRAFKIMMKGRTDINRLTAAQAVSFCQQNFTKIPPPPTPTSSAGQNRSACQPGTDKAKDGVQINAERVKDAPTQSEKLYNQPMSSVQDCKQHDDVKDNIESAQHSTNFRISVINPVISDTQGLSSIVSTNAPDATTANLNTPELSAVTSTNPRLITVSSSAPVLSPEISTTTALSTSSSSTPTVTSISSSLPVLTPELSITTALSTHSPTTTGITSVCSSAPVLSPEISPTTALNASSPTTSGIASINSSIPVLTPEIIITTGFNTSSPSTPCLSTVSPTTPEPNITNLSTPELSITNPTTPELDIPNIILPKSSTISPSKPVLNIANLMTPELSTAITATTDSTTGSKNTKMLDTKIEVADDSEVILSD